MEPLFESEISIDRVKWHRLSNDDGNDDDDDGRSSGKPESSLFVGQCLADVHVVAQISLLKWCNFFPMPWTLRRTRRHPKSEIRP